MERKKLEFIAKIMLPNALINYNYQSFQLQGAQDSANFQYELPMGLANYGGQSMDVVQNNMPTTLGNQNK